MTRDEALDALNELLESAKTLRVPPHIGVKNLQGIIDVLSSPCAICRGEEPIAEWRGWQHKDWKQALGSPKHPGEDCCHLVRVLIFALPAGESHDEG